MRLGIDSSTGQLKSLEGEFTRLDLDASKRVFLAGELFGISEGFSFNAPTTKNLCDLFLEWQLEDALVRLNGRYFGFVETEGQITAIFNDLFAERRIYYTVNDPLVAFSDDAKDLVDPSSAEVDEIAVAFFLMHGHTFGGDTFFRKVKKLPPATIVRICNARIRLTHYYRALRHIAFKPTTKNFLACLSSYVRRLISSTLRGRDTVVLLSGGVDSSLLLTLLSRWSKEQLSAFTVSYKNPRNRAQHIDLLRAKRLTSFLGVRHETLGLDLQDALSFEKMWRTVQLAPFDLGSGYIFMASYIQYLASLFPGAVLINGENSDAIVSLDLSCPVEWRNANSIMHAWYRYFYSRHFMDIVARGGRQKGIVTLSRVGERLGQRFGKKFHGPTTYLTPESYIENLLTQEDYMPFPAGGLSLHDLIRPKSLPYALDRLYGSNGVLKALLEPHGEWSSARLHRAAYTVKLYSCMQGRNIRGVIDIPAAYGSQLLFPYRSTAVYASFWNHGWGAREVARGKHQVYDSLHRELAIPWSTRRVSRYVLQNSTAPWGLRVYPTLIQNEGFRELFDHSYNVFENGLLFREGFLDSKRIMPAVRDFHKYGRPTAPPQLLFRLGWVAAALQQCMGTDM